MGEDIVKGNEWWFGAGSYGKPADGDPRLVDEVEGFHISKMWTERELNPSFDDRKRE